MSSPPPVSVSDFDGIVLLLFACIVFFMQAGFAMLEAGAVSPSLKTNIIYKNLVDSSLISLSFWALGYGLAFGRPSNAFAGLGEFLLIGTPLASYPFVFFQWSFTTTTATILSGGIAGRLRILGYMVYCSVMGLVMHPVVSHWIWDSTGWLNAANPNALFGVGTLDFAGGLAVHVNGGVATLVAVCVAGYRNQQSTLPEFPPRFEKMDEGKWKTNRLPPADAAMSAYGAFILWFGFFAFNMGSFVVFTGKADLVGLVGFNTAVCSAASAVSAIVVSQAVKLVQAARKGTVATELWQLDDVINGTLVGLVSITSGCALVSTWAAFVIGLVAGILYQLSSWALLKMRIDDAVQAVPVHMVGGLWSSISAALFAERAFIQRTYDLAAPPTYWGLFLGGSGWYLASSLVACVVVSVWTAAVSYVVFLSMFMVDSRLRFKWFFLRSSYQTENVGFGSVGQSSVRSLGIADVTSAVLQERGGFTPQDEFLMFKSDTPREEEPSFTAEPIAPSQSAFLRRKKRSRKWNGLKKSSTESEQEHDVEMGLANQPSADIPTSFNSTSTEIRP